MADGAHQGVGAERALDTILGGKPDPQESQEKTMTPDGMQDHLESASIEHCDSYDGTARYCGKLVLNFLVAHPEYQGVSAEAAYISRDEPPNREAGETGFEMYGKWRVKLGPDLFDLVKAESSTEDDDRCLGELTGFMWGWAVNAAKYALGAPPVPNPALLEIG